MRTARATWAAGCGAMLLTSALRRSRPDPRPCVGLKEPQPIQALRAVAPISADPHACRGALALLLEGIEHFVGEGSRARDDSDVAGDGNMAGDDPTVGLPRGN